MTDLLDLVKKEAAEIDCYMRADLASMGAETDPLLQKVLDYGLFNGGKRVRPLLVVICSRLCGNRSKDAYRLGMAFEYLHAATLFHDDIIDGSATRRGKPAVYKEFDIVAAILAGDFLHAHSMALVSEYAGSKGLASFCRATKGMVDGEFMQLQNAEKHNLSEIDYYNAIMGKTGLLIAAACEVGAIFAGADEKSVTALRKYGENLGCAFQIIDDILDYLGDSAKTGKAVGNDLAEGKMTLPLILALQKADSADKMLLMQALKAGTENKDIGLKTVIKVINRNNGFTDAREHAERAIQNACNELRTFDSLDVRGECELLQALGYFILKRDK
ncbi:polyprenyl synthetase family protein [Desulforhopalus sp. IMCC35007]|uniref:polyprenyl synthetase family protein n=1 Tax=Desulforhopalus sp. IMCC35007 TaxID=2569543 RepID=UPI0010AEEB56|nr:polyprenyl synthetase family protein [Desulforhopalus sp. IMCC35007]TKB06339.1 polyprenyl synthetase family protein [Desulforhopalus sp. IMCC35007]